MNKHSGMYPRLRVDRARVPAVGQAGGVLLTQAVEASGLGMVLSQALAPWRKPLAKHDSAKVLLDLAISLALGGDACRDAALLRSEPGVYGPVASDPTISRTITALAADVERVEKAVAKARATARQHVWGLVGDKAHGHDATADKPVIIDLDATLVTSHSDKEQARPTFKKGYGFHPLLAFVDHGPDGTGESVAALLRPGNAGSNTASDHEAVIRAALKQIPGLNPARPGRKVLIRTDGAGGSKQLLGFLARRGLSYSIGFTLPMSTPDLYHLIPETAWQAAYNADGQVRDGAAVVEFTDLLHAKGLLEGRRIAGRGYRDQLAAACFQHAARHGDAALVLYDVTTLYFEAEHEDELRKVGYSKERRVDPQIIVGLLVDRLGFPLEIGSWEGNKAETQTIIPAIHDFKSRHQLGEVVVVADAGMLSMTNLEALHQAGLGFIVGSRPTKAPGDLAKHFTWHGDAFADGQLVDTITPRDATRTAMTANTMRVKAEPVWDLEQYPHSWRAVWHYSHQRALHDRKTLTAQENKARAVVAGEKAARTPRFVTTHKGTAVFNEDALARAKHLVGLKGYVTNIPMTSMTAQEVVDSYHDLWHVEHSFRMSKHDLRARPIFHHHAEAIEAHLTIVFAALAIARWLQNTTGISIKKLIRTLRPLRQVTIQIAGQAITAQPHIDPRHQGHHREDLGSLKRSKSGPAPQTIEPLVHDRPGRLEAARSAPP